MAAPRSEGRGLRSAGGACQGARLALCGAAGALALLAGLSVSGCRPPELPEGGTEAAQSARPFSLTVDNPAFIVDGEVSSGGNNGSIPGTPIDQKRDLGRNFVWLDPELTFDAPLGERSSLQVRLGLLWSQSEGISRAGADLIFDHRTFPADTRLDSELFMLRKGLVVTRRFGGGSSPAPELRLGAGVEMLYGRQVITAPSLDMSDVEDYQAIYPLVTLQARWGLREDLAAVLSAEAGLPLKIMEDRENSRAMLALFLERRVAPRVHLRFGYVYLRDRLEDGAEDPPAVNVLEVGGEGLLFGVRYDF